MITGLLVAVSTTLVTGIAVAWRAPAGPHSGQRAAARDMGASRMPAARPYPAAAAPSPPAPRCHGAGPASLHARLAAALASALPRRQGRLAVGVLDPATGVTVRYHGGEEFHSASIVKADVLAVLLIQHQRGRTVLSEDERELSAEMIEDSDNDAATVLWDAAGGASGIAAGNAALRVHAMVPGADDYWGLTTTTAASELRLLSDLTSSRSPLAAPGRHYELSLMRHVVHPQAWGVTVAASPHTHPAVKNGWMPDGRYGLWVVNSIGVVRHAGRWLDIAVLSSGQPSEAAGIREIQAAAGAAAAVIISAATGCP